jgi:hypothetical protein
MSVKVALTPLPHEEEEAADEAVEANNDVPADAQ